MPTTTDRKSTRLNSSHLGISYAVFCLKKKKKSFNTTPSKNTSGVGSPSFHSEAEIFLSIGCRIRAPFISPLFFFFYDTATTEIYTLSLHDALPILRPRPEPRPAATNTSRACSHAIRSGSSRSEEHTSELQSLRHLVCRLLLEK